MCASATMLRRTACAPPVWPMHTGCPYWVTAPAVGLLMPERIRILRGVKGWNAHGARYCTHRTKFGNPFYSGPGDDRATAVSQYEAWIGGLGPDDVSLNGWCYHRPTAADIAELRDRNLACYCRLDQPCHADVLLRLANQQ